jgi:hypothetical protein
MEHLLMTDPIIPDLINATPGDPPPTRIGTAWCTTPEGLRAIPVYAEWPDSVPLEGGIGVVTDLQPDWTINRVELDAPATPAEKTVEEKLTELTEVVDILVLDRLGEF